MPLTNATRDLLTQHSQYDPEELELNHEALAILLDARLGPKSAFVLAGSEDLRALLPKLDFSTDGAEAFILVRPYIHTMALYLRCINQQVHCLVFDSHSQAWGTRYYPTRLILDTLVRQFPRGRITLSSTPLQPQDIQRGCNQYALTFLTHCAEHGDKLFSSPETLAALPKDMSGALEANLNELNNLITRQYTDAAGGLDHDAINATVARRQGCTLGPTRDLPPDAGYRINVDICQYTITLHLDLLQAQYGNFLLFCDATYPSQIKSKEKQPTVLLSQIQGLNIDTVIDNNVQTIVCKAQDLNHLQQIPELLRGLQVTLFQKHMRQQLALHAFADALTESIELALICQRDQGGFEQAQVQLALQATFRDKPTVFIPPIEMLAGEDAHLPLASLYAQGFRHIALSIAADNIHQVGAWINITGGVETTTVAANIFIYDSYVGYTYPQVAKYLQTLIPVETTLSIEYANSPYVPQGEHESWCGVYVIEHMKFAHSQAEPSAKKQPIDPLALAQQQLHLANYQAHLNTQMKLLSQGSLPEPTHPTKQQNDAFSYLMLEINFLLEEMSAKQLFITSLLEKIQRDDFSGFIQQISQNSEHIETYISKSYDKQSLPQLLARIKNELLKLMLSNDVYLQNAATSQERVQRALDEEIKNREVALKETLGPVICDQIDPSILARVTQNMLAFNAVMKMGNKHPEKGESTSGFFNTLSISTMKELIGALAGIKNQCTLRTLLDIGVLSEGELIALHTMSLEYMCNGNHVIEELSRIREKNNFLTLFNLCKDEIFKILQVSSLFTMTSHSTLWSLINDEEKLTLLQEISLKLPSPSLRTVLLFINSLPKGLWLPVLRCHHITSFEEINHIDFYCPDEEAFHFIMDIFPEEISSYKELEYFSKVCSRFNPEQQQRLGNKLLEKLDATKVFSQDFSIDKVLTLIEYLPAVVGLFVAKHFRSALGSIEYIACLTGSLHDEAAFTFIMDIFPKTANNLIADLRDFFYFYRRFSPPQQKQLLDAFIAIYPGNIDSTSLFSLTDLMDVNVVNKLIPDIHESVFCLMVGVLSMIRDDTVRYGVERGLVAFLYSLENDCLLPESDLATAMNALCDKLQQGMGPATSALSFFTTYSGKHTAPEPGIIEQIRSWVPQLSPAALRKPAQALREAFNSQKSPAGGGVSLVLFELACSYKDNKPNSFENSPVGTFRGHGHQTLGG